MKAWFIVSGKDATSVELRDVPVPEPKAGELLVKVHAAGLNRGGRCRQRNLRFSAALRSPSGCARPALLR